MSSRAWYLRCTFEDVGTHAVLVGDRGRVALAADLLEDAVLLNEDRGLTTATGTYRGVRVTVSAFGMGAPIAAVVMHELADLGVGTFLRLGTVLALGPTVLGDLVVAHGAVRGESTGTTYLPLSFPAVPDLALTVGLAQAAQATGRPASGGLFATFDGFYTQMFDLTPDNAGQAVGGGGGGGGGAGALPAKVRLAELERQGVVAVDMETSALLVAARALRVRAGSLCLASVSARSHERLDHEERVAAERDLLEVGLSALVAAPAPALAEGRRTPTTPGTAAG